MTQTWRDYAWVDRHGRVRTVSASADDDALVGAVRISAQDAGWPIGGRWLRLAPDEASCRPSPWQPDREIVLCDLVEEDGSPSDLCPRTTLKRALAVAAGVGCEVIAAAEVEFHLSDLDGNPVSRRIDNYGIVAGAAYEHILGEVRALRASGVPVTGSNPEYGGGQFEINLLHEEALRAADAVSLLRSWIAVIAGRYGLRATFAAKPWPDGSGSGLHFHQSLWRGSENAFFHDGALSRMGEHYLAGLLDALPELAVLGSPTPAAYRRRSDGSFCPTTVSWGGDNRTVAVRVLADDAATTRIEQRDAASNANIHHALAGQVRAGMRGVALSLEPPPRVDGNAYDIEAPPLPRTLHEALALFADSQLAGEVLGEEPCGLMVTELSAAVAADLAGQPLLEVW